MSSGLYNVGVSLNNTPDGRRLKVSTVSIEGVVYFAPGFRTQSDLEGTIGLGEPHPLQRHALDEDGGRRAREALSLFRDGGGNGLNLD